MGSNYTVGDVFSTANEPHRNRRIGDIASERGEDPFTTPVNIAIADDLKTVLWPPPFADTDADWELRRAVWEDPDVLIGGSDAGAHLDRMLGSPYPTRFLADCLRGRRLLTMERAARLMTDIPARLFGLRDRGRLAVGWHADIVVFDPERVGGRPGPDQSRPARRRQATGSRPPRSNHGSGQRPRDDRGRPPCR
jgi:N-acyl-D-aspartate/D-glutamate deacylase